MRKQMYNTMKAAEKAFEAITEHLTADKQPAVKTPGPDYSSISVGCKYCEGVVVFEDYDRQFHATYDSCTCTTASMDDLNVPSDVKAIYAAVHAKRAAAQQTTPVWPQGAPGPMAPLDGDIREIRETLDKHRKALAIIGTFGAFQDIFFGTKPNKAVHRLVGLQSCGCVGTGWVARDETCKTCGQSGYLEA
jgi:hypothetical protein